VLAGFGDLQLRLQHPHEGMMSKAARSEQNVSCLYIVSPVKLRVITPD